MDELDDYIWISSFKEVNEYETHISGIMDELKEVEQMMKLRKGWSWMMVKLGNEDGGQWMNSRGEIGRWGMHDNGWTWIFFLGKVRGCSTFQTNQFSSNFKLF